jgi:CheY-like chemotaxis protein
MRAAAVRFGPTVTAAARIRQNSALRKTPIVALTAHREADLRDGAQACGFTAYVTKPIDFDWLDDLLRRLLE